MTFEEATESVGKPVRLAADARRTYNGTYMTGKYYLTGCSRQDVTRRDKNGKDKICSVWRAYISDRPAGNSVINIDCAKIERYIEGVSTI